MKSGKHIHYCILFTVAVIFQFGCNINPIGCETQDAMMMMDTVSVLYKQGKIKECISKAQTVVKKYPKCDLGWHLLSSALLADGNDSLAEVSAKTALGINSFNHVALTNIGIVLDNKEAYKEAEQYYKQSLQASPNAAQTYSNYASNRLRAGDNYKAILLSKRAIELADNVSDKVTLCLGYHLSGQLEMRDSIYDVLVHVGYQNIESLSDIINETPPHADDGNSL